MLRECASRAPVSRIRRAVCTFARQFLAAAGLPVGARWELSQNVALSALGDGFDLALPPEGWCAGRGLNPRHPSYKDGTLTN